ncbi:MAG: RlmE family RNA methyltransferase [Bdellovibrionales bacterium]|nr:RlmE family RNA methyltransferase [Bdellovibrionales bacterium]
MAKPYNRKDHHYNNAKEAGLRSRAFFKLEELDQKYKIIKPHSKILDLGAWPGSWIEYCAKKLGPQGRICGIDLAEIEVFPQDSIKTITGDVFDRDLVPEVQDFLGEQCDLILSDLSPKLTGIKDCDQAAMCSLLESVVWWAETMLKPSGVFVAKAFKGQDTDLFVKNIKKRCKKVLRAELKSTRNTSQEFYIVGWSLT